MPAERNYFFSNDLGALGAAVATGAQEIGFDLAAGDWKARLQSILHKLSCHAVMDIHLTGSDWDEAALKGVVGLLFDYDAMAHTRFTVADAAIRERLAAVAPEIPCNE